MNICACNYKKRAILEYRFTPEGGKWSVPVLLCPDCNNHREVIGCTRPVNPRKEYYNTRRGNA